MEPQAVDPYERVYVLGTRSFHLAHPFAQRIAAYAERLLVSAGRTTKRPLEIRVAALVDIFQSIEHPTAPYLSTPALIRELMPLVHSARTIRILGQSAREYEHAELGRALAYLQDALEHDAVHEQMEEVAA